MTARLFFMLMFPMVLAYVIAAQHFESRSELRRWMGANVEWVR
jgi:phage shock protein PspC (stress-responsive transcriptional regulator)